MRPERTKASAMTVFDSNAYDGHEAVIFHADPAFGLEAIVAIHSSVLGPAFGGLRMRAYASDTDALEDALRLSKGMTYKAAMADLPFGGGKAVIIGDPRIRKTEALLRTMGRFIESLNGRYHTADDMGTTVADMDVLRMETRFAHGFADASGKPPPATAFGVFAGIRAAVAQRLGRDDLDGLGVAIQGLGNVGARLARYLAEAGARLQVADIERARVERARDEFGARAVAPERIHAAAVDIFAPCAAGAIINDRTVGEIRASIVAGAANNQLDRPCHGAALKEKGIPYAPDYVINAGGLIDVACEGPDYDPARMLERVARIYDTASEVFERARIEDAPTDLVADRMVRARLRSQAQSMIAA